MDDEGYDELYRHGLTERFLEEHTVDGRPVIAHE